MAAPIAAYAGAHATGSEAEPLAVHKPQDVEQIQALIKRCRAAKTPITTFSSSGPGRRRGATSSRKSVFLDLSAMKRVFHIDAQDAVAVIEPGVTFAELDAALAPHGLRTFKPLAPRPGKSVIASYLEREPILNVKEQWDVLDPLGAAEVVFGTGETFHTGSAAAPGTMDEHWRAGMRYLTAMGPVGTDFMRVLQGAQGTLGVVTWAAVFCERRPTIEKSYFIGAEEIEPLIQICSELNYRRLGGAMFIMDRSEMALLMVDAANSYQDVADQLPAWVLFVSLAAAAEFPQDQISYEAADLAAIAAKQDLMPVTSLRGVAADDVRTRLETSSSHDHRAAAGRAYRELFFLTQIDRAPGFIARVKARVQSGASTPMRLGVYLQPRLQGRNCHLEFTLGYGAAAPRVAQMAALTATALAEECAKAGGLFSRPYAPWTKMAFENHQALVPFLRHTKQMFDPDGILNPGRLCF
ncbi:FAD-binding oxidoreductase [Nitrospirillum iridis]|uniref:FAD/FMN-containing dehydrogenase n=1 Tax=Nitrospirillum iridis TaxID=765888 RepID=A0A7X0AZZ8_9PROT|nr:FAD-binding oxidoreductase [Nitrospirillum iridis]MBB6253278.1 FAD/FMN-containing dehydrogenase [Nitrospirillum iridis]